ncbi:MAG: Smr/MutS family protein [Candidatus Amulumruptor caecigallinarius]|nr:Smr/MutS family protein [Candidatus Amulumruptor caecigallinarius]
MIYPSEFESKIGFDTIRAAVRDLCSSRLGKEYADKMSFSDDYDTVMSQLNCVAEMVAVLNGNLPYPSPPAHDVTKSLQEIKAQNSFMPADKLHRLAQMLHAFVEIKNFFDSLPVDESGEGKFPNLRNEVSAIRSFPSLVNAIENCINKFGEVKDTASDKLYEIRQSVKAATGSMQRAMRRVMDSAISQGIIDKDAAPGMRGGRLVIPVSASLKRSINGIVHDESATGKTVFIEPIEVVEAGNRLRQLQLDENREIVAILTHLSDFIRPDIDNIISSCYLLAKFDFIEAKAKMATDLGAQLPNIERSPEIEWYHAEHPALKLSLRKQGREIVPLNLHLNNNSRILIISGPNAGGKSVTLKTVAVVQYMMQCGLLPTIYYNSHMGIFENLFIDIGDEQSIENDLSTYSSHLRNMRFFLLNSNKRTLLLADEIGSGTEPRMGGAIAQAILRRLGETGCYGIVTTHYHNLKSFAEDTDGFVNGAMLYDRQHLQPTYQLSVGTPGSSFALDIAYKMGLPNDVVDYAKKLAGEDYVNIDKYVSEIIRDKKYWSNKRQNIREKEHKLDTLLSRYEQDAGDLKSKRKEIINDARKEAAEILSQANARIERTILEIRKSQADKERTKELRRELADFKAGIKETENDADTGKIKELRHKSRKSKAKPVAAPTPVKKEIEVGDYVKLSDSNMSGEVLSISGKQCVVAFGALRTIVEKSRLVPGVKPKKSALSQSYPTMSVSDDSRQRQLNFKNEIDVRGMRADEALQAVTYFIDDAIQFNASKVRILHGTGHGILKTLIRQQLKANPAIASFEDEDVRFGGAGITVVNIE